MVQKAIYIYISIFFISYLSINAQERDTRETLYLKKGNSYYLSSSYEEAASNYLLATQINKNSFKAYYNLGNAMYRLQKNRDAAYYFERALQLAQNKEERANTFHNLGNAYFREEKLEKAEYAYKMSLKNNPSDDETRYNYTITKQKLDEKSKTSKGEEAKDKKSKDNPEDQSDENSDNQGDNIEKPSFSPKDAKEDNPGNGEGEGSTKSTNNDKNDNDDNNKLNKLEEQENIGDQEEIGNDGIYDNILKSVEKEEQATQRRINNQAESTPYYNDKDW